MARELLFSLLRKSRLINRDLHSRFIEDDSEELCIKETRPQELQTDLPCAFGESSQNYFTAHSGSKLLTCVNKEKQMNTTGNRFSQLDNNESCVVLGIGLDGKNSLLQDNSTGCNLNKHKETVPRDPVFQHGDTFNNRHKREKTVQRVASFVFSTIVSLWIFFNVWSQLSFIHVQPLHKEHLPVSIWLSLLGLLGFMVFVWAFAIMILVGAPFTRMQSAMLISLGILMHLKSVSIVFVPILGILFMGWYLCSWKKQPPNEGK